MLSLNNCIFTTDHPYFTKFNFPAYVIHLESATTREPLIQTLKTAMDLSFNIFQACTGAEWWQTMPRQHPWRFDTITQGMMGCAQSHLDVLRIIDGGHAYNIGEPKCSIEDGEFIRTDDMLAYIFEDDATLVKPVEVLNTFLHSIDKAHIEWDVILLGANDYVLSESIEDHPEVSVVKRFWGTHAMLVKRSIVPKVRKVFYNAIRNGIFLPLDWLYNESIKNEGLRVVGPTNPREFIIQAPGFVSASTGKTRF